jgi:hypothetical protein
MANPFPLTGGSPAGGTYSGPGVSGNTFYPGSAGTGFVTLTYTYNDVNGCSTSANDIVYVDLCMDVQSLNPEGSVNVYPNPSTDATTVSWNGTQVQTVQVFDATGRMIYEENVNGRTQVQLNTSDWAMGIYSIRLTGESTQTVRFIRQ